jgi:preprotein translocase subunit SecE
MNKLARVIRSIKTFIVEKVRSFKMFMIEVKVELIKCAWPSRKELFGSSVVVIISVIILGAYVGICDLVNMGMVKFIIR